MKGEIFALIGVVVGVVLTGGWDWIKRKIERRKMRNYLRSELEANARILPQKRDVLEQMLRKLQAKEILPGTTVRFMTMAFSSHFSMIADDLPILERNSYHCIYERLRVIDETMEAFASDVLGCAAEDRNVVMQSYVSRLGDLLYEIKQIEVLIDKHLAGSAADVFHVNENLERVRQAVFGPVATHQK